MPSPSSPAEVSGRRCGRLLATFFNCTVTISRSLAVAASTSGGMPRGSIHCQRVESRGYMKFGGMRWASQCRSSRRRGQRQRLGGRLIRLVSQDPLTRSFRVASMQRRWPPPPASAGTYRLEPTPFSNLSSLIAWANRTGTPNAVRAISDLIKQANRDEVDPHALAAMLVKSIILTVSVSVPEEERPAAAANLLRLMHDQFTRRRIIGRPRPPEG
jgi:hypothetical protein